MCADRAYQRNTEMREAARHLPIARWLRLRLDYLPPTQAADAVSTELDPFVVDPMPGSREVVLVLKIYVVPSAGTVLPENTACART
jgi:hypothetical protein